MTPSLLLELSHLFAVDASHRHDTTPWTPYGGRVSHHDERTGSERKRRIAAALHNQALGRSEIVFVAKAGVAWARPPAVSSEA